MDATPRTRANRPESERKPARFAAYAALRDEILRTPPDESRFLTEEAVAEKLGISRTPIREAFQMLQSEGLIRLVPRKGAVVVPITAREVREVMEVRSMIEVWCAERVVADETLRPQVFAEMDGLHRDSLSSALDVPALISADRSFHRSMVSGAKNHLMLDVYERMRDTQLRLGTGAVMGDPDRLESVRAEHGRIVAALGQADREALVAATRDHLVATEESFMQRMRPG